MRVKYEDWKIALSHFMTEAYVLKFLRVIKPTFISLGLTA